MTTKNDTKASDESRSIDGLVRDDILEISQHELDRLDRVRLDLHEIAKYNAHVSHLLKSQTATIWAIVHKKRKSVSP